MAMRLKLPGIVRRTALSFHKNVLRVDIYRHQSPGYCFEVESQLIRALSYILTISHFLMGFWRVLPWSETSPSWQSRLGPNYSVPLDKTYMGHSSVQCPQSRSEIAPL